MKHRIARYNVFEAAFGLVEVPRECMWQLLSWRNSCPRWPQRKDTCGAKGTPGRVTELRVGVSPGPRAVSPSDNLTPRQAIKTHVTAS
eukprot:2136674-Amphidinium_carterae.2